ncbi:hypothetical protein FB45DRAFT_904419 [Roridomyces roridus]|uniref:BRCT domain-containing protein n=1 Tax=Roridomyces roridus TaxID=1738132 RepID=A0AAD7C519_9AGAR|nr:hypothetical protein FB45DRAFT_904419 [Roridomyces roridus]
MDAYFTVTKSASTAASSSKNDNITKKRSERKYQPYTLSRNAANDASKSKSEAVSGKAVDKFLLSTLSDANNPLTRSDIGEHIINVISTSTGHQVSEHGGNRRVYLEHRSAKLSVQTSEAAATQKQPQVLANVRCYINGLLEGTTDMEMKRIIVSAGGTILMTPSNATHILTSQYLSGSKTDKLLKSKSKSSPYVVKPEWVTDSIAAGKRRSERQYSVLKDSTTKNLFDMLKK